MWNKGSHSFIQSPPSHSDLAVTGPFPANALVRQRDWQTKLPHRAPEVRHVSRLQQRLTDTVTDLALGPGVRRHRKA